MIRTGIWRETNPSSSRGWVARADGLLGALVFQLCRGLARLLVRTFYRRVDMVGLEHVPQTGPLLVAATHPNGLVDALLILATLPRRVVPVAAAPQFRWPLYGTILRLLGALPAHRLQDRVRGAPGRQADRNAGTVAAGIATLRTGGAILLYPEGTSHPQPRLLPLKTGAARMALGAAASSPGALDVTLLPVGLLYHRPATFRAGTALVRIGRAVPVRDLLTPDGTVPEGAVHALTARLTEALCALTIQAGDRETLNLLGVAEACWRAENTSVDGHPTARVEWMEEALRVARRIPAGEQPRVETLRQRLARYQRAVTQAALRGPQGLPRAGGLRHTGTSPVREAVTLLVELPFVVGGWLRHLLPFLLTRLLVRLARPEPEMEATWKLVGGLVLYPLCWLLEGLAAWYVGGPWLLAGFLAWLVPGGIWLLAWHGRWARVVYRARETTWAWRHAHRCHELLAERRAIVDDMRALTVVAVPDARASVAAVPAASEPVAAGESGAGLRRPS